MRRRRPITVSLEVTRQTAEEERRFVELIDTLLIWLVRKEMDFFEGRTDAESVEGPAVHRTVPLGTPR